MVHLLQGQNNRQLYPHNESKTHVSAFGMGNTMDIEIWQYAHGHDYMIVTKDADFSELIFGIFIAAFDQIAMGFAPSHRFQVSDFGRIAGKWVI